jgi:hypothetical protein
MKKQFLVLALSLFGTLSQAAPLILESEAGLPNAPVIEPKLRGITRGPAIRQLAPAPETTLKSPFDLRIAFEPRGGAAIDLASVKVVYLKSPSVDLLERVRPGLSARGIELGGAEAPAGEHLIRVSVQDSEGRQTHSVIKLSVAK